MPRSAGTDKQKERQREKHADSRVFNNKIIIRVLKFLDVTAITTQEVKDTVSISLWVRNKLVCEQCKVTDT